jgi:hypothetical protein
MCKYRFTEAYRFQQIAMLFLPFSCADTPLGAIELKMIHAAKIPADRLMRSFETLATLRS